MDGQDKQDKNGKAELEAEPRGGQRTASALVVVNCSQLVTLAGPRKARAGAEMQKLSVIEDGAMLVKGGVIELTGTRAQVEPHVGADARVLDAGGRVVLPGFVDAHAHPVFAGNRADEFEKRAAGVSYQEIAAAGGGIRSTVRRTRAADEDELVAEALRRAEWFLRTGTTTVEAKSGYGLSVEDELKMLRVVRRLNGEGKISYVPTFLGAHEIPDELRERRD
ncbi:MAG: imidazolonepropionase, partial [Rubrivivax sp.]|nr:imidazolonepropionase [Pyrinomonadaceae bacterium]